jgi:hypothetical protein
LTNARMGATRSAEEANGSEVSRGLWETEIPARERAIRRRAARLPRRT